MHSTHNKDAAKWDRTCAAEHNAAARSPSPSNQAAVQAKQREDALARRREEILAQQQQQQQQQRSGPSRQSQSGIDPLSALQQIRAEQQRRLALRRLREQQQNQGYGYPVAAPAPGAPAATGYPVAAVPAPPPSPSDPGSVDPSVGSPVGDAPATTDVLTPGAKNASLVGDQTAAKRAKSDLSVFGVALGDPVTRPRCSQLPVRGSDTCVAERGLPRVVASMFQGRVAKLSGFTNVPVQLADSQCPDWLKAGSCTVVFAIKDGYPYAAFMVAGGEDLQGNIETLLNQKYNKSADKGQVSQCQKELGTGKQSPLRVWSLHGVRAEYDPVGVSCTLRGWPRGTGQIVVETETFRHLTSDAEQAQAAKQAKM